MLVRVVTRIEGLSIEGEVCPVFHQYGFCCNDTLYTGGFSFMFVYFPFNSFKYLMLLFRNKCQPAVAYESVLYKQSCNVWQSSKHDEITSPSWVYVCVYPVFHWNVLSKKCQKWRGKRLGKKNKGGRGWPYRTIVYRRGFKLQHFSIHHVCSLSQQPDVTFGCHLHRYSLLPTKMIGGSEKSARQNRFLYLQRT